jgi:phospholipid/cholesterol/gamma-HCH transport system substrate-binding protein
MKIHWKQPRTVGLIGITSVALLGLVVTVISSASFGAREYHAVLSQTAGLRVGESVQIAGVDVGEVRDLKLSDQHVLVTFTVDADQHLGSSTSAVVRVATLLGTHYLQIHPAGPGSLANGTIPLERTSVPYNLQDVMDKGTDQLEALDTDALSRALSAVTDTLRASGRDMGPATRGLTRLSAMITRRGSEYEQLFGAARDVSDQLAGSADDLITLMRTSNQFLAELNTRRAKIHRLLIDVQRLATTVSAIVTDNQKTLGPLLRDLDTVITILTDRERDLKTALHRVAVSGRYLANATGNGPWADLYIPDGLPDSVYCKTKEC